MAMHFIKYAYAHLIIFLPTKLAKFGSKCIKNKQYFLGQDGFRSIVN